MEKVMTDVNETKGRQTLSKSMVKGKLKSLENKYSGCNINLIDMSDKYKNAYDKGHITTPTYYRLSLPDLLLNMFIFKVH